MSRDPIFDSILIKNFMNRPPPYFPQNQLSPPDEKRYRKLKLIFGLLAVVVIAIVGAAGYGLYYLISSLL